MVLEVTVPDHCFEPLAMTPDGDGREYMWCEQTAYIMSQEAERG
jgi:hypothetical protein